MPEIGITAGTAVGSDGERFAAVKIQHDTYELNILFVPPEWERLNTDLPLCMDDPAIVAGTCCGKPVHWSRDNQHRIYVSIGDDDETWDIGFLMPPDFLVDMLTEIRREFSNG
ncbi:hypothetical protein [Rhodopirellula baltica]